MIDNNKCLPFYKMPSTRMTCNFFSFSKEKKKKPKIMLNIKLCIFGIFICQKIVFQKFINCLIDMCLTDFR